MKSLVTAMALVAAAGATNAQSIEFRVVERNSQVLIPTPIGATLATDGQLNYAVQGRVVGGANNAGIGNFSFNVIANGELDSYGPGGTSGLFLINISNSNGTYNPNPTNTASGANGPVGLASQYRYLIGINPNFGGLINTSGGTFVNTVGSQEIGLITGSPTGAGYLQQIDLVGGGPDGDLPDGNPDNAVGSTAPIDATYGNTYLGSNGNFVDLFRFKYSPTVASRDISRNITFTLSNVAAQIATGFQLSSGVWGPVAVDATFTVTPAPVVVVQGIPAPASAALLGLGGLVAARRRRTA